MRGVGDVMRNVASQSELVLDARERLRLTHPRIAQRVTPQLLSIYFRYLRNLSLLDRRLTPDLYTLIVAAQQTAAINSQLPHFYGGSGTSGKVVDPAFSPVSRNEGPLQTVAPGLNA